MSLTGGATQQRKPAEQNAQGAPSSQQVRGRLNQILYWQLADELKLSAQTEKSMVQVIEDIQSRRERALKMRLEALTEVKASPHSKEALKKLRKALGEMAALDVEEFERLEKVLGADTLAQFYLVREKVIEKISQAMKSSASK